MSLKEQLSDMPSELADARFELGKKIGETEVQFWAAANRRAYEILTLRGPLEAGELTSRALAGAEDFLVNDHEATGEQLPDAERVLVRAGATCAVLERIEAGRMIR